MSTEDDDDFGLTEDEFLWVEFAKGAIAILGDPTERLVSDPEDPRYPDSAVAHAAEAASLMLLEFKARFRSQPIEEESPAPDLDPSRLS